MRKFAPVTIAALLGTLVLIFAFQADNITARFFHVVLIAVPITLQVYLNAGLAYGLMKWLKVEYSVAAPGALIGASNFFELAVATAIALFGPGSGAALAKVVGVLVEVPVMLSVCAACNRTRHWFPAEKTSIRWKETRSHSLHRQFRAQPDGGRPSAPRCRAIGSTSKAPAPAGYVRPEAIAAMRELGIDISGAPLQECG